MKNLAKFIIVINLLFILNVTYAQESNDKINNILNSAENFFKSLADKNFTMAWALLTKKSQDTLVNDVYNASKAIGVTYTNEQLHSDFKVNGFISRTYWNGFLKNFDPNVVLEECLWEKVLQKEDYAEIVIRYKKSENPFHLKMFKEGEVWKVGLVETFWSKGTW